MEICFVFMVRAFYVLFYRPSHRAQVIQKSLTQLHKNAASNTEQVLETVPYKTAVRQPTTQYEN